MGKKKKTGRKDGTSKGERRNTSSWLRKQSRHDNRVNPSLESLLTSRQHKQEIITKYEKKTANALEKKLAERYLAEESREARCFTLLSQYGVCGLTRAAAIQAIRTDKVPELLNKWKDKHQLYVAEQRKSPGAVFAKFR